MDTRIRELREQHGLGQETLANFVGSSQQTISRIENGKCVPPLDLVVNIAKYFRVTVIVAQLSRQKSEIFIMN